MDTNETMTVTTKPGAELEPRPEGKIVHKRLSGYQRRERKIARLQVENARLALALDLCGQLLGASRMMAILNEVKTKTWKTPSR